MAKVEKKKCEDCKYFDDSDTTLPECREEDELYVGTCHRRSPIFIEGFLHQRGDVSDLCRQTLWPCVYVDSWCGEFKAKAVPAVYPSWGDIHLSWRVDHILLDAGINDAYKLVDCSAESLLRLRGFGESSLSEVRKELRHYDLFLVGDEQLSRKAEEKEQLADAAVREALGIDGPNEDKK